MYAMPVDTTDDIMIHVPSMVLLLLLQADLVDFTVNPEVEWVYADPEIQGEWRVTDVATIDTDIFYETSRLPWVCINNYNYMH